VQLSRKAPPSSSGLGHLVLSQRTGVRLPLGVLDPRESVGSFFCRKVSIFNVLRRSPWHGPRYPNLNFGENFGEQSLAEGPSIRSRGPALGHPVRVPHHALADSYLPKKMQDMESRWAFFICSGSTRKVTHAASPPSLVRPTSPSAGPAFQRFACNTREAARPRRDARESALHLLLECDQCLTASKEAFTQIGVRFPVAPIFDLKIREHTAAGAEDRGSSPHLVKVSEVFSAESRGSPPQLKSSPALAVSRNQCRVADGNEY
jgi:hypothetical protein